jgi:uncharacterized phiE125 gp8 family phage protein
MALTLVEPPTSLPVSVELAKSHLRVDTPEDDDLITHYINQATEYLDGPNGILGIAIMPQTWDLILDEFPDGAIQIPLGPLLSIEAISYDDVDGVPQAMDPSDYYADTVSYDGWVLTVGDAAWPSTLDAINVVRVRFVAGHVTVPTRIKQAILLKVGAAYQNRESVQQQLPPVSDSDVGLVFQHVRLNI